MEFCFGLLQTRGSNHSASWISLAILFSMLCMLTSVEGWSYHYSSNTMNWTEARDWCMNHYTHMVAIQNQGEIKHLSSWLPKKKGHYWIGIRKKDNVWTWVGTNKTLTPEATNWAKGEPNNAQSTTNAGESEDCVEMYIQRPTESGKWNDESCRKSKTALCYTAACKKDSCLYGECVETINSHRCNCYKGFYGEKCEQVVKCNKDNVTDPDNGSVNCTAKYGNYSYDSQCSYSCVEGYQLSMQRPLRCTENKTWSEQPPTCELIQCPKLSHPKSGSMKCSDPLGPSSYQSTCVFTCDEGYELAGSPSNTLQCEASGEWDASAPLCVPVRCPALHLENASVSCGDDADMRFSYGNTCSFSCVPGYNLVGQSEVTCTSAAKWSEEMPRCEAITCQNPEAEAHLIPKCSQPLTELRPDSTCSFSCEAGFELQGVQTIQCSEGGQWTEAIPTCKAIVCPAPEVPTRGYISCTPSLSSPASAGTPHASGTVCTFSCDEGHELQGALSMECVHSGQWTSTPPTCTAVRCPLLKSPENGQISCSNSELVYNSQCSFTCNQDYSLDGHELLTCNHHGNWTGKEPSCQAPASQIATIATSVAGGGALSLSALSLAMWILKRMKQKATKFELNSNSDIEAPPQVYKSSVDSLI